MKKRLYRVESEKMIGGVAAGLGRYFEIDPTWVRLLFIGLLIGGGSGFLIYVILWIALPSMPYDVWQNEINQNQSFRYNNNSEGNNEGTFAQTAPEAEHYQTNEPNKQGSANSSDFFETKEKNGKSQSISGIVMVTIGVLFLLHNFRLIQFTKFWPLILIVVGIGLLLNTKVNQSKKSGYEK